MAMMLLTLRGTPTIYFGDELGMLNATIPAELTLDPWGKRVEGLGRDGCRTPMQWSADGGFSSNSATWLPMGPEMDTRNVATQETDPDSMLSFYRSLLALRSGSVTLAEGSYQTIPQANDDLFVYERSGADDTFVVALNFSDSDASIDAGGRSGTLVLSTMSTRSDNQLGGLILAPQEGAIFRT